jgi:flagellar operon protein
MNRPIQNARIGELIATRPQAAPTKTASGFESVLDARLKLSGHAQTRMASRNIELDQAAWERVLGGVEKAAQKGARDSLVLVDDAALVISVKNRTVITMVDRANLKENVFTNIDSAVIV